MRLRGTHTVLCSKPEWLGWLRNKRWYRFFFHSQPPRPSWPSTIPFQPIPDSHAKPFVSSPSLPSRFHVAIHFLRLKICLAAVGLPPRGGSRDRDKADLSSRNACSISFFVLLLWRRRRSRRLWSETSGKISFAVVTIPHSQGDITVRGVVTVMSACGTW